MKHSGIPFFTLPMDQVPAVYWQSAFPQPYWTELVADAGQATGSIPYLVASLIRQESEFNAGAVSHANALGLMQLLPVRRKVDCEERWDQALRLEAAAEPAGQSRTGHS